MLYRMFCDCVEQHVFIRLIVLQSNTLDPAVGESKKVLFMSSEDDDAAEEVDEELDEALPDERVEEEADTEEEDFMVSRFCYL